ncbi:MAG TPA: methyltransferase domain-containing protein [Candidatus Saccharimonadales bacterium]|nr:methyltransferase domain-containing protein [Candidatus Saccharimonadales bacterium]
MVTLLIIAVTITTLFCVSIFFGPPYLPTMHLQAVTALNLLSLKPGQTLLELGSGDGRVARLAAQQGLQVVGIEINPLLVLISRLVTWRYRRQVHILWGSYWHRSWPPADGIFTFMIQRQMTRLDNQVMHWHEGPLNLASFAFRIPGKHISQSAGGVFLYSYD